KGASMSGLGKPPAGYGNFGGHGALGRKRRQFSVGKPFGYELQQPRAVSNADNLTNDTDPRYLQNCISELGYPLHLLGFLASLRQQIGEKGDAGFEQNTV
ncbi:MAG TPA: hypothetical protein VF949_18200, partial [Reyranella sp.]